MLGLTLLVYIEELVLKNKVLVVLLIVCSGFFFLHLLVPRSLGKGENWVFERMFPSIYEGFCWFPWALVASWQTVIALYPIGIHR